MDAVIFAGEHEFERCPLSLARPKPLWPMAGGTLLDLQLQRLAEAGVSAAVVCVIRGAEEIHRHLAVHPPPQGLTVSTRQDWPPRGPAGCLRDAAGGFGPGPHAALEIGAINTVDWHEAAGRHAGSGAPLSVGFTADPDRRLRPAGLYVWDDSLLGHIPAKGFQDLKERLLPALAALGRPAVPLIWPNGTVQRVDHLDGYLEAVRRRMVGAGEPARPSLARVDPGAEVHPAARLLGPVWVEPGARVDAGAVIVGPTLIGAGSRVGSGAVIRRSVIWSDAEIAPQARTEDCVVTDRAHVPGGDAGRRQVFLAASPGVGGRHVLRVRGYAIAST